jgi:hypothetical protein
MSSFVPLLGLAGGPVNTVIQNTRKVAVEALYCCLKDGGCVPCLAQESPPCGAVRWLLPLPLRNSVGTTDSTCGSIFSVEQRQEWSYHG